MHQPRTAHLVGCLIALLVAARAQAAAAAPSGAAPAQAPAQAPGRPGENLRVYLITFGPGEAAYEKFGHNAIWIHDPDAVYPDVAYHYGVFDFGEGFWGMARFIGRFVQGLLMYRMGADDAPRMIDAYAQIADRSIWIDELNLTPPQRLALRDFLDWNLTPPHDRYRYDYYRNNCSTKVRDALDGPGVLDGQIAAQTSGLASGHTYRWQTRRLMQGNVPLYTALDAALGQPVDRPISQWEDMFLPGELRAYLKQVRVRDEHGTLVPLIKSEPTYHISRQFTEPGAPPDYTPMYLLIGALLGAVLALLAWAAPRHVAWRSGFSVLACGWLMLIGGGGTICLYGWLFTDHWAAAGNENLFQINPVALALCVLAPLAVFRRRRALRLSAWLACIMLAGGLLGVLLKALPWFRQSNWDIIALVLPVHAGLAAGLWLAIRRQQGTEKVAADSGDRPARSAKSKA